MSTRLTLTLGLGVAAAMLAAAEPAMTTTNTPTDKPAPQAREAASFGMGCFWCGEAVFQRVDGVLAVASGYQGGHVPNPTYPQVCTGETGHAEVVHIEFDPARVSYSELLDIFWQAHDPTTLNRQGADVGEQYRSVIFTYSDEQQRIAEASKAKAQASGTFKRPIVTDIRAAPTFYKAEEGHQNFYNSNKGNGYCRLVISPKLKKLGMEE